MMKDMSNQVEDKYNLVYFIFMIFGVGLLFGF